MGIEGIYGVRKIEGTNEIRRKKEASKIGGIDINYIMNTSPEQLFEENKNKWRDLK